MYDTMYVPITITLFVLPSVCVIAIQISFSFIHSFRHVFIDTPGQIEVFTWSASGNIISESLVRSCLFAINKLQMMICVVRFSGGQISHGCHIRYGSVAMLQCYDVHVQYVVRLQHIIQNETSVHPGLEQSRVACLPTYITYLHTYLFIIFAVV